MAVTNNLEITKLEASQAQKEVTINEALVVLDSILNNSVIDKDLTTPPGSPSTGDTYIIAGPTASGDWADNEGKIAFFDNSAWRFITPKIGLKFYVADEGAYYFFDGTNWVLLTSLIELFSKLGINTSADSTNKLALRSNAALFTALYAADSGNGDFQHKINKESAADTASQIFQNNFQGRAEFGLLGDDDLKAKVSPDGSTWHDVFTADKDNGEVAFNEVLTALSGVKPSSGSDEFNEFLLKNTYTANFIGQTTAGANTYGTQEANYSKISSGLGVLSLDIGLSGALNSTGTIYINLPFTGFSDNNPVLIEAANITYSGQLQGLINGNKLFFRVMSSGGAVSTLTHSAFGSDARVRVNTLVTLT